MHRLGLKRNSDFDGSLLGLCCIYRRTRAGLRVVVSCSACALHAHHQCRRAYGIDSEQTQQEGDHKRGKLHVVNAINIKTRDERSGANRAVFGVETHRYGILVEACGFPMPELSISIVRRGRTCARRRHLELHTHTLFVIVAFARSDTGCNFLLQSFSNIESIVASFPLN